MPKRPFRPLPHHSRPKHIKHEHTPTDAGPSQQLVPSVGQIFSLSLLPLRSQPKSQLNSICLAVTTHIQIHRRELLDKQTLGDEERFNAVIEDQPEEFWKTFEKAADMNANDDDRNALLNHDAFWVPFQAETRRAFEADESIASKRSQRKAVERSWTADFVGMNPLKALETHVSQQMKMGKAYARYCSIVQSSGMGKSRLLDEFSKEHFLIPINLRPDDHGFPPPDDDIREFLTSPLCYANQKIHESSYIRARRFLQALFGVTTTTLADLEPILDDGGGVTRKNIITKFREFMSEGQLMNSSGEKQRNFYQAIVDEASRSSDNPSDAKLHNSFKVLRDRVNGKWSSKQNSLPDIFIMSDEAHPLTKPFEDKGTRTWSHFVQLQRALRVFTEMSLFTFFLSTTWKISQFSPSHDRDPSYQMNDGKPKTPHPFIFLGFDQLMGDHKIFDKYKTLEDMTSLECIAHMGRPLWGTSFDYSDDEVRQGLVHFAAQKLLCRTTEKCLTEAQMYAVLSQRLPLDINSTTYIPLPPGQVEKEQEQISNHICVCMSIGDGIETIRGIAASEPILSEAASLIMSDRKSFHLADALAEVLSGFGINPGDRAELLVSAFFTWARDKTVSARHDPQCPGQLSRYFSVTDLFSSLFSESTYASMSRAIPSLCPPNSKFKRQTFEKTFSNALMHYNHFIKAHEQKVLKRPHLLAFMARGAAAFGANCQPGFDILYPFLFGGNTVLSVKKLGLAISQIKKNDLKSRKARARVFKKMDPYACGLLDLDHIDEDDLFPISIIRIVFALCSDEPGVTIQAYSSPLEGASYLDCNGHPRFISYDFWCLGVNPDILQPVKEAPDRWTALANKADSWKDFYNTPLDPGLLRSLNPGAAHDHHHFDSWSAPIPGFEDIF